MLQRAKDTKNHHAPALERVAPLPDKEEGQRVNMSAAPCKYYEHDELAAAASPASPASPRGQQQQQQATSSSTTSTSTTTPARTRRNRLPLESVTWVGDQWFLPDGYRVYTPLEMRDFFSRHSSVWIGDSTIRRAYLTLHAILTTKDNNTSGKYLESKAVMNVNKREADGRTNQEETCQRYANYTFDPIDGSSLICRTTTSNNNNNNNSSAFMTYLGEGCSQPTTRFLTKKALPLFQNYSIVIISTGLYDAIGRCERRGGSEQDRLTKRRARIPDLAKQFMEAALSFSSSSSSSSNNNATTQQVVYRTLGHQLDGKSEDMIQLMNQHMLNLTKNNSILSVDWGEAVKSRSFGEDRIVGDNGYHYGHSARILFIQMLMNRLVQDLEARGEQAFSDDEYD
jgi:hypothetical protein